MSIKIVRSTDDIHDLDGKIVTLRIQDKYKTTFLKGRLYAAFFSGHCVLKSRNVEVVFYRLDVKDIWFSNGKWYFSLKEEKK